jgi:hypothetical protein
MSGEFVMVTSGKLDLAAIAAAWRSSGSELPVAIREGATLARRRSVSRPTVSGWAAHASGDVTGRITPIIGRSIPRGPTTTGAFANAIMLVGL